MPSIEQLQRLLDLEPDDAFLIYGIAQEHLKAEQYPEAIEWFDRTLAADPDHCYAYFFKARALDAGGANADALTVCDAGIANAQRVGDTKAYSELSGLKDELSP